MNIIRKSDKIKNIADDWEKQYRGTDWWLKDRPNHKGIWLQLRELPSNATEDQVNEIIGNSTWTCNMCERCNRDLEIVIEITTTAGDVYLCPQCIRVANKLCQDISNDDTYKSFQPRDQVAYLPDHANGDLDHPAVEFGFVTSVFGDSIFCRYFLPNEPILRTRHNSEMTSRKHLIHHEKYPQEVVDKLYTEISQPMITGVENESERCQ